MGDYNVHRVRIGDWVPSPIKSIASDLHSTRVAVGREDGDIEICDSSSKWYCQARIPGKKDFQLQSLLWSSIKSERGRLFGVSLRGFLFEVDLATLKIKNIRDSYGGAVWCVAGSPRSATIAIGCEDGAVRLYKYDGNGSSLEYHKTLPTSGTRIVSIAYHPTEPQLFIGCIDGTVRCLDEATGRVLFRMTGEVKKGSASTIIWSLLVLHDSTVVTGDNRGNVQIWDGVTGVQISSYHHHNADVLALAVNHDETSIFASGVDGKVVCLQKTANDRAAAIASEEQNPDDLVQPSAPSENTWVYSHSHRAHSHDVYSLALCYTPNANATNKLRPEVGQKSPTGTPAGHWILLSGGLDTKMCTYSATNFVKVRPSWIPAVPANSLVNHSAKYDVVTMRHRHFLDIWHIALAKQSEDFGGLNSSADSACQLKLRLQAKDDEHIHASALSTDGQYVAISSSSGVRMWRIVQQHAQSAAPAADKKASKKAKGKKDEAVSAAVQEMNPSLPVELIAVKLPAVLSAPREFVHALQFNHASTQLAVHCSLKGAVIVFDIVDTTKTVSSSSAKKGKRSSSESEQDDHTDEEESSGVQLRQSLSLDHLRSVSTDIEREEEGEGLSQAVKSLQFSPDDRFVAVTSCAEEVYLYDTVNKRLHWRLPRFAVHVTDVQFSAANKSLTLLILTANNNFVLFDVHQLKLSAWSEENGDKIPKYIRQMPGSLSGIAMDGSDPNKLVLYGQGYCVLVKLDEKVPKQPQLVTQATTALMQKTLLKKRKALKYLQPEEADADEGKKTAASTGASEEVSNFVVVNIYRNLLHIGLVDSKQLVVVENPWVRTVESLPGAVDRKRYGT